MQEQAYTRVEKEKEAVSGRKKGHYNDWTPWTPPFIKTKTKMLTTTRKIGIEMENFSRSHVGNIVEGKLKWKKKTDNAYILDSIELHKFDMCGLWLGFACCMFVKSHVL